MTRPTDRSSGAMRHVPAIDRFWLYVERVPETDCWLWTGPVRGKGYGYFTVNNRTVAAHRFAYTHLVRPIPGGLVIDHMCRMPLCVNPGHLRTVTPAQNVTENSLSESARNKQRTHCKHGHPLDHMRGRKRPIRCCWPCRHPNSKRATP